jgi:methyl-accepting chemotaxis protein
MMLKNMGLASKLAFGFGTVVVLTGILGFASWWGVSGITRNAALSQRGVECAEGLNRCAGLRRDFAISGFELLPGREENAAELWHAAFDEWAAQVDELKLNDGLDAAKRQIATQMRQDVNAYLASFTTQEEARRQQDEAFAAWGKVGWDVTGEIQKVLNDVIIPARQAAEESGELAQVIQWNKYSEQLDKSFVQPFLLMRVTAVYLLATNKDAQWQGYQTQLGKVREGLQSWTKLVADESQLRPVADRLAQFVDDYAAAGEQYYGGVVAMRQADQDMAVVAKSLVAGMSDLQTGLQRDMNSFTQQTYMFVTGVAGGAIVLGILLAVLITRSIVRPVRRIIESLSEGASQVTDASSQVSGTSQQLAEGASEQASSLEETSSALEQMAAMTRTNAQSAQEASELSTQARTAAKSGDETMQRLNQAMDGINESSEQIGKIIKVIEEIAFQTNLLALNAAVEAARAGEHGKGFAVVAEEVRNLAQRAAGAARETTDLIEQSVQRSRDGSSVAGDVTTALTGIVGDIAKVAELIDGIARASNEQAQGVEQVNTAVSQMDKVTQSNAAAAEESASAAEELSAQAVAVNAVVGDLANLIGGSAADQHKHSGSKRIEAKPQPVAQHHFEQSKHFAHQGSSQTEQFDDIQGGDF